MEVRSGRTHSKLGAGARNWHSTRSAGRGSVLRWVVLPGSEQDQGDPAGTDGQDGRRLPQEHDEFPAPGDVEQRSTENLALWSDPTVRFLTVVALRDKPFVGPLDDPVDDVEPVRTGCVVDDHVA